jgi:chemotaxis protein methyltransferase CheR
MTELVLKDSEFQTFSRYVQDVCGINLHEGKKELLKARLGKILRGRNFRSFHEYYDHVVNDKSGHELTTLLNSISTNLTYFFREPQHFEFLRRQILPELLKSKIASEKPILKFWSAGCSTGEEAYSIAITASEALDQMKKLQIKILASDLSTKVLTKAGNGIYEKEKIDKIPHDVKRRYLQKGDNRWEGYLRVKKEIRELISFRRLNLMEEFRFRKPFDVIFCRNVMIYFDGPTKELLVEKFYQNLSDRGYFLIGHAESLTGINHNFKYIKPSVFRKQES